MLRFDLPRDAFEREPEGKEKKKKQFAKVRSDQQSVTKYEGEQERRKGGKSYDEN